MFPARAPRCADSPSIITFHQPFPPGNDVTVAGFPHTSTRQPISNVTPAGSLLRCGRGGAAAGDYGARRRVKARGLPPRLYGFGLLTYCAPALSLSMKSSFRSCGPRPTPRRAMSFRSSVPVMAWSAASDGSPPTFDAVDAVGSSS